MPHRKHPSRSNRIGALLDEITAAQSDLEASILATKAEKLAGLIALVERRISNILTSLRANSAPKIETPMPASILSYEAVDESERTHLAVVPLPEQPELPIPSPAATQPPSIALVRTEAIMAEVAFIDTSAQRKESAPETTNTPASEAGTAKTLKTGPSRSPRTRQRARWRRSWR